MKKLTKEEFIARANKIHGGRYDYSKFIYINFYTKGIIICKDHGEFLQDPTVHLRGGNCPECVGHKRMTTEVFIERSNKKYNNKYDYSEVKIINCTTKIIIGCPIHGKFKQQANVHILEKSRGCPKCIDEINGKNQRIPLKDLIERFNKKHNNKYDYSKIIEHKNIYEKIIIICPFHGEFTQLTKNHMSGRGCPKCDTESKTKSIQIFILESNQIHCNKYDYSKFIYINSKISGIIFCKEHGEFLCTPNDHLSKQSGCPKCYETISKPEIQWLDSLSIPQEYRHKTIIINKKRYNLDAFDPETKTVYEFYGDYWHGNPFIFSKDKINNSVKKTFGELYNNTIKREAELKSFGYKIISIWENDFKNQI